MLSLFPLDDLDAFMLKQRVPNTMNGDDALLNRIFAYTGERCCKKPQIVEVTLNGQVHIYQNIWVAKGKYIWKRKED